MIVWYYTKNGEQQEPVDPAELKRLAGSGSLKPTDLVWKDGMAEWVQASTIPNLFSAADVRGPDRASAETSRVKATRPERSARSSEIDEDKSNPAPRRRRIQDEDEEEDDDRHRRRRARGLDDEDDEDDKLERRVRRRSRRGLSTGALVAIIGGAVVLVLGIGVALLIYLLADSGNARTFRLATNEKADFRVHFNKGKVVEVFVKSDGVSDVDLFVFDANGREVAKDERFDKDCYVRFTPAESQRYKLTVWNRLLDVRDPRLRGAAQARNGTNSGTLTFQESAPGMAGAPPVLQPNPPQVQPPPGFPQPGPGFRPPGIPKPRFPKRGMAPTFPQKIVFQKVEQLTLTDPLTAVGGSQCRFKSFDVKLEAGVEYYIVLESQQFDAFLRLTNEQGQVLQENDDGLGMGLNSLIIFRPQAAGTYRVIATSLVPQQGVFTLTVRQK